MYSYKIKKIRVSWPQTQKHKGLYYFETKIEYDTWVSETLDSLAKPVKNPDANQTELPDSLIPEKPSWKDKDEINEA